MPRRVLPLVCLCALLLPLASCREENAPLGVSDLTPAELEYVTRFVQLERARAVALRDRPAGEALLDSLAAAWGDSALARAESALSPDTDRLAAFHDLLSRLLEAEEDSLLDNPSPERLTAPLPAPATDEPPPPPS
ncbi:hypothetical protein KDK88_04655 [bacterium]|nr:hypothetical protein [bacterium]